MRPVWIVVTFGNAICSVHTSKDGADAAAQRLRTQKPENFYWTIKRELED